MAVAAHDISGHVCAHGMSLCACCNSLYYAAACVSDAEGSNLGYKDLDQTGASGARQVGGSGSGCVIHFPLAMSTAEDAKKEEKALLATAAGGSTAVIAQLLLLVLTILPLAVSVPANINIIATASMCVFVGCWRSAKDTPPSESMTKKVSMQQAPDAGSFCDARQNHLA